MFIAILKAFIIGICASAPLGPCAILVIQKSLAYGRRRGFITALGATTCDTIWAAVSIFAVSFAEAFIDSHKILILILGGLIVTMVGISMAFKDPFKNVKIGQATEISAKDYFQSLATAMSNPAAIFVMLTLFTFFDVEALPGTVRVFPIILAVSCGSMFYWYHFTWLFSRIRKVFKLSTLVWINRVAGLIVLLIGLSVFVEGIYRIFFS
ncbi:MAG: LysE family transporter [Bacteroidales bacterium]|nr:LysE family transporter [Bacteroidales bacterium]